MGSFFLQRSRHQSIYYFRRKVPLDLQAVLGQIQIYRTLATSDRKAAIVRARAFATRTDAIFQQLRMKRKESSDDDTLHSDFGFEVEVDELFPDRPKRLKFTDVKTDEVAAVTEVFHALTRAEAPGVPAAPALVTMTVAEAAEQHLSSGDLKPRTAKRYRSIYKHFAAFVGEDTQLHEITRKRFTDYVHTLKADNSRKDRTKANYITIVAGLFNWAHVQDDRIPPMSARKLKPRRTRPAHMDRARFSMEEIRAVFEFAAQFRLSEPARFWATVVTAFLGCRIEELAQADLSNDIRQEPVSGTWYLVVAENDDESAHKGGKSVKEFSSWRQVPFHSALVKLGWIEYLEKMKAAGGASPFDLFWKPYKDSTGAVIRAHSISKWGSRRLQIMRRDGLITTPKTTFFHSHRHTVSGFLAGKGVSPSMCAAICGQEATDGGINSAVYAKLCMNVPALSSTIETHMDEYVEALHSAIAKADAARKP